MDAATRWARYWPWARNNGAARFLGPGRLYETRYPDPMANNRDDGTRSWDAKARWQMGSLHAPLQPLLGPNVTFDRAVGLHTHPITAPKPFFSRLPPGPLPGHSAAALHRVPSHARRCKKELYRKPTAHSGAARRNPSCGAVAAACTAADFGPQAFRHLAFTTHALQPGSLVHRRRGGLVRPGAGEAAAVKRTLLRLHSSSLFT